MKPAETLYAWVAPTEDGTEERIIWSQIGPVLTMLVSTDIANLPKMREAADLFVREHGRPARLLRSTDVSEADAIYPPQ